MSTRALGVRASVARPSPTLAITAKANAMKAAGVDVISFGAGEPDFNTPEPVCRAAIQAIEGGFTKYTPSAGIPALREAVADKFWRENGLRYEPSQVVASCGAKHSVFNALWVLLDPGDEVILFAPYWMTYRDQIALCGGVPVVVPTRAEDRFVPSIDDLKAAITPRTKAILVNSPSNPTGAVFPRETLKQIAALAMRHDLWVISDEIYERLVYEGKHESIAALGKEIQDRTITISGCSKTYSMTGWRIGYMAAPEPVAKAVSCFQDQVTSNPTSFVQRGAIAALALPDEVVEGMRAEFASRLDLTLSELAGIPGLVISRPAGAFYVFVGVQAYLGERCRDDVAVAELLLEEAHVALVPGSVFEGPGFLRLSYTASPEQIREGIQRMARALQRCS
ncbi:MAG: pyridoxal phosphate-dependent aminotransferase [Methanoregulaceae archaeon]|nr:pyridoxal phosphate-dependent aminotransferase [Methanoregulaceae archaeon]